MDWKQQLERCETSIEEEIKHIASERARIDDAKLSGHHTDLMDRSLAAMKRALAAFEHHREILLKHISNLESDQENDRTAIPIDRR
jgi:hypothetical protein